MNTQYFEAMIISMMDERDEWSEVVIANEIAAMPEQPDNAGRHYPLTDEEAAMEVQDLIEAREDEEWHARGEW